MSSLVLAVLLASGLVLLPATVGCLALRRLWLSRSRNAVLYWLVSGFALAGAAGAAQTGLAGAQVDAGGMAAALASLPLWLLVRVATSRGPAACTPEGPVFTSVRRLSARGGLRDTAARLTTLP